MYFLRRTVVKNKLPDMTIIRTHTHPYTPTHKPTPTHPHTHTHPYTLTHTPLHTHPHTHTHANAHTCVSILFSHIIGIDNHRPLSPQNVCKHRSQACSHSLLAETFPVRRRCNNNKHIFLSSHQSSSQACRHRRCES